MTHLPSLTLDRIVRFVTIGLFAAAAAAVLGVAAANQSRPPNIVLLFMDNVGYADLGAYGNTEILTPHIDRFAAQSLRATQFYIGSPSCTPSRGALLTARHPHRTGLNRQLRPDEQFTLAFPAEEKIIPAYLKPLGYATACFGKWNIGFAPGGRPLDRGFDEFLGHASGNANYYTYKYSTWNDARKGNDEIDLTGQYSTDVFADAAVDFIRRHKDRPFFVYVPFNAPHIPSQHNFADGETPVWQAPEKYMAMYGLTGTTAPVDDKRGFYAVMTAMDYAIGRILDTLDHLKLSQNTIVVLMSDNGAFMLPRRGLGLQSNAPFRDGGVTCYEGGIRVVTMIRWPGRLQPGSTCDQPLWSMDLLPFFITAAGGQLPTDRVLDGKDPTATLMGSAKSPHQQLAWVWRTHSAFRAGDWKLVRPDPKKPWELYNLAADPGETTDLAAIHPQIAEQLRQRYELWIEDTPQR